MNEYKFKNASKLRSYVNKYDRKRIRQEIKRVKSDIVEAAKEGRNGVIICFSNEDIAKSLYEKITPELIYKGYTVSYLFQDFKRISITIDWEHGGTGPFQIEERLQEYYKTLREIRENANNSN